MKDTKWIKDIKKLIGTEAPLLFKTINNNSNNGDIYADKIRYEILTCAEACKLFLNEIRASANSYTFHDIQHSINVIEIMGQLIDIDSQLSSLDIACLIFSALLHDIGMVKLGNEEMLSIDYIRNNHGKRSEYFIENNIILDNAGLPLCFGTYHNIFKKYIPKICASHMEDFSYIETLPKQIQIDGMKLNLQLCAIILRVSDAMDLFRNRAPITVYRFLNLHGISKEHWEKHLSVTDCFINDNGFYQIDGICEDELAHRALFNHIETVESELKSAIIWSEHNASVFKVKSNIVNCNIQTYGYNIWQHSFQMDYLAISQLFMGEQLYGNKNIGLREIIQNSIDACLVRYEYESKNKISIDDYRPIITILDDDEYIYIIDNGTGMTDKIIRKFFLNIGVSYYQSDEYINKKLSYKPMGFFGIGFLAGFMLSDEIWVKTSYFTDNKEYSLHLMRGDKYVSEYSYNKKTFTGTEIKLKKSSYKKIFPTDTNLNHKDNKWDLTSTKDFILRKFWQLDIIKEEKNKIVLEIKHFDFETTILEKHKNMKTEGDYEIHLSKFLQGIEGCIFFKNNDEYRKIWEKSMDTNLDTILNELKSGNLELGGRLEKTIPFCQKSYIYSKNKIKEIHYLRDIPKNYIWLLIPNTTFPKMFSKIINYRINPRYENKSSIEMLLYKSSWFSIFIPNKIAEENLIQKISVSFCSKNFELINSRDLIQNDFINTINEYFNKKIDYFLIENQKQYYTHSMYESTFYTERTSFLTQNHAWLKSTKIEGPYSKTDWLMFVECYYTINIKSEKIIPQASRDSFTDESNNNLFHALEIAKYLWLLNELKTTNASNLTIEYIIKKISGLWNENNPLLRSDLYPNLNQ